MDDLLDLPEYLSVDFDPSSVKVSRLRGILVENDVPIGSATSKASLISLFEDHVAPKVPKLRNARLRATRSSFGIINANEVSDGDHGRARGRTTATPRRPTRMTRQTPSAATPPPPGLEAEPEPEPPATVPASHRMSVKRQSSRPAEDSLAVPHKVKKSSRSHSRKRESDTKTPARISKASEDWTPEAWSHPTEDSPFRTDNPFQSGSLKKRKSSSKNRRTLSHVISPEAPRYPSHIYRRSYRENDDDDDDLSDSEVQSTVMSQLQVSDYSSLHSPVQPTRPARGGPSATSIWVLMLAIFGAVFTIWRQEKIRVGYCGSSESTFSVASYDLPEWLDRFRPVCEDCPHHAFCYENMEAKCEPGFVLSSHPFSLGGIIPLVPSCQPDGEQTKRIKGATGRVIEHLRETRAAYECQYSGQDGEVVATPEIEADKLKFDISSMRKKSVSGEQFEDLWKNVEEEFPQSSEVQVRRDGEYTYYSSNSLARVPITCSIRRWVRRKMAKLVGPSLVVLGALAAAYFFRRRYIRSREMEGSAKFLAGIIFRQLVEQAHNNDVNPERYPERFLSVVSLRDDLLREEYSLKKRLEQWKYVQSKVEYNSNVRTSVREMQNGEVSRVWEWIGTVRSLDDDDTAFPLGSARVRKRSSMGTVSRPSSSMKTPPSSAFQNRHSSSFMTDPSPLTSRWQKLGESRPSLNADELVAATNFPEDVHVNVMAEDPASSRRGSFQQQEMEYEPADRSGGLFGNLKSRIGR